MTTTPLRSSVVFVDVVAAHDAADGNYPAGTAISLPSDHVVAIVTTTPDEDNAVALPSSAPVGATVEVHRTSTSVFRVQAPSGENIEGLSFYAVTDQGVMFRKITATRWGRIGG